MTSVKAEMETLRTQLADSQEEIRLARRQQAVALKVAYIIWAMLSFELSCARLIALGSGTAAAAGRTQG